MRAPAHIAFVHALTFANIGVCAVLSFSLSGFLYKTYFQPLYPKIKHSIRTRRHRQQRRSKQSPRMFFIANNYIYIREGKKSPLILPVCAKCVAKIPRITAARRALRASRHLDHMYLLVDTIYTICAAHLLFTRREEERERDIFVLR